MIRTFYHKERNRQIKLFKKGFFEDAKVQIILTSEEDFETELNLCKETGYKYGCVLYLPSEEIIQLEKVNEIL